MVPQLLLCAAQGLLHRTHHGQLGHDPDPEGIGSLLIAGPLHEHPHVFLHVGSLGAGLAYLDVSPYQIGVRFGHGVIEQLSQVLQRLAASWDATKGKGRK